MSSPLQRFKELSVDSGLEGPLSIQEGKSFTSRENSKNETSAKITNGETYLEKSSHSGVGLEMDDTERAIGDKGWKSDFQKWVMLEQAGLEGWTTLSIHGKLYIR